MLNVEISQVFHRFKFTEDLRIAFIKARYTPMKTRNRQMVHRFRTTGFDTNLISDEVGLEPS